MSNDFQVIGTHASAPFSLKLHRGDGMLLLAMNWKSGTPPDDFVGFAIEYQEPGGDRFYPLKNRLSFGAPSSDATPNQLSTRLSDLEDHDGLDRIRSAAVRQREPVGARLRVSDDTDHAAQTAGSDGYQMTWPPSTRRSTPVTNDAARLSRKMTGPTMSSG